MTKSRREDSLGKSKRSSKRGMRERPGRAVEEGLSKDKATTSRKMPQGNLLLTKSHTEKKRKKSNESSLQELGTQAEGVCRMMVGSWGTGQSNKKDLNWGAEPVNKALGRLVWGPKFMFPTHR